MNADHQGSAPSFEEDSGVLGVKKELNCVPILLRLMQKGVYSSYTLDSSPQFFADCKNKSKRGVVLRGKAKVFVKIYFDFDFDRCCCGPWKRLAVSLHDGRIRRIGLPNCLSFVHDISGYSGLDGRMDAWPSDG